MTEKAQKKSETKTPKAKPKGWDDLTDDERRTKTFGECQRRLDKLDEAGRRRVIKGLFGLYATEGPS